MKLVCGLGNPGAKYSRTRHNVGFMIADALADFLGVSWNERFNARVAKGLHDGSELLLVEPLTFMNLSGHALVAASQFFKVAIDDILVVHDDVDLEFGRIMLKSGGGDGGHKGIRSIIQQLGARNFARLRVGVGRPVGAGDVTDYVLSRFHESELEPLDDTIKEAVKGILAWAEGGCLTAQNRVNRKVRPEGVPSCPGERRDPGPKDREEV